MQSGESHTLGSVTQWIEDLRNCDPNAVGHLWERFVNRMIAVANRRLKSSKCRVIEGDDIASQAFHDFFNRNPEDFSKLVNRNDLWKILVVITERRAIDAIRKEETIRRGGNVSRSSDGVELVTSRVNPPDIELMLVEAFEERLGSLDSDLLQQIAVGKMNGLKNVEIAELHDISLRSVERKLKIIRTTWQQ